MIDLPQQYLRIGRPRLRLQQHVNEHSEEAVTHPTNPSTDFYNPNTV